MLNKEDIWRRKGNYHEEDLVSTEGKCTYFRNDISTCILILCVGSHCLKKSELIKKKLSLIMFVHVGKAWGRRWKKSKDDLKTCEIQDLRKLSRHPSPPPPSGGKRGLSKRARVPEGENCMPLPARSTWLRSSPPPPRLNVVIVPVQHM